MLHRAGSDIARRFVIVLLVALCAAAARPVIAATTGSFTVQWDANTTDADLAGYRVYISTNSGTFSLTPAQAAAVATTRNVPSGTTQTLFTQLDPSTVYWIGVTTYDTSANESGWSNIISAQPRDVTAPSTAMTAPGSGSTVSGTVTVSANASDDVAVVGVQFRLDGNNLGAEDTTSPFSIAWDTTLVPNGSHSVSAVARDAAGNSTTSSRTVNVSNADVTPPVVTMTAPAGGSVAIGMILLSANASDNVGVAGVQFQIDAVNVGAEDTVAPYSLSWNSTTVLNGSHTVTARARDAANNRTTSTGIVITVNNPDIVPPTVAITAPLNGSTAQGVVIVSANASDNQGVAGVQFKLDGANLGTEKTVAPYALTWSTTTVANGSHALTAVARDAAGNTATSFTVLVNVNNTDLTPPVVSMTAPVNGALAVGTVTLSATASDNVGVIALQFQLDGANLGSVLLAPPYTYAWDTLTATNGVHALTATARDAAGNSTTATVVSVTVSNVAPSLCGPGLDPDNDGICNPNDNCASVYNPSQKNTDGDNEGGDACDITIIYPTNGSLTCADAPPTISWSPETYHMFKVFIGATVSYSVQVTSGKKMLLDSTWTMPAGKWATICKKAKPFLFIKVQGKNPNSKWFEYSETTTIVAK